MVPFSSAELTNIPDEPGCYLFRDAAENLLYIGKAKNLHKRVSSYLLDRPADGKTQALVSQIRWVDFFITQNETEALILENNLIKKYQPKYNINLKDAKSYAYIRITDEKFPRLEIARGDKRGEVYGPFVSAAQRDQIIATLNKIFGLRTCRKLPRKPCLRFHLGHCVAPCRGQLRQGEYPGRIRRARMVLKGKTRELIKGLTEEMTMAAQEQNFEHALELRKQVEAIQALNQRQTMERTRRSSEDIINYVVRRGRVYLMLFGVDNGVLNDKQEFVFPFHGDFLEEFLVQYYADHPVPAELILPVTVDESLIRYLGGVRGKAMRVITPRRGEKRQLLLLVVKNIETHFFSKEKQLEDLQLQLNLDKYPLVIECFDISHLSGTAMSAAMVQFHRAKPAKRNYRRFRIKTVQGINDTEAIAEVVKRRYSRLIREQSSLPDLVLIDGGVGQLNAALQQLKELGLSLRVVSLAKRFEEIYIPGLVEPLRLDRKGLALQLLQRIRDEAHRFAIQYNRLLRKKKLTE